MIDPFHPGRSRSNEKDIAGHKVSVMLSRTSMAIIVRYVTAECKIEQCLIRVQLLAKSLVNEEIARELISLLQVQYGIGAGTLLAAMHDRASTNTFAMSTAKVLYPDIFDIFRYFDVGCLSHPLDHVHGIIWVNDFQLQFSSSQ